MKMKFLSLLVGASSLVPVVLGQTWSACNPMNTTVKCANNPALGTNHTFVFNTSTAVTSTFNITAGSLIYGTNGTEFVINKKGDSPTIQSQFYIFFGSVSVVMQAASGQGIISSIVLESDDLDEVDWEFLGGNGTHAETNYFGKGNTTSYDRAIYHPLPDGGDPRAGFHNYTVHWTSSQIEWYIDSVLIRTLPYASANEGKNFPQTPMNVRLGIWAGGDPDSNSNGTIEWAGGVTNYTNGPYTMTVQSAQISDFSTGSEYEWTDASGSFTSIKVVAGNSTAVAAITKSETPVVPTPSLADKFAALPTTTKIAVYAGSAAAGALLLFAAIFSCIRARRNGKREQEAYAAKVAKEREDQYKEQVELREKGVGGWDMDSKLGDDALGGWGGTHVGPGVKAADFPDVEKSSAAVVVGREVPSRIGTPGARGMDPGQRMQTPSIVSPLPQSPMPTLPRSWTSTSGGSQQAGNPFSDEGQPRNLPAPMQRSDSNQSYGFSRAFPAPYNSNQNSGFGAPTQFQTQRSYGSNGGGGAGGPYSRF